MRIIKLTNVWKQSDPRPVYVVAEMIGHISRTVEDGKEYTSLGVTTHNNGGFKVKETPEEIIKLIKKTISI
jgi:hypothetical protein